MDEDLDFWCNYGLILRLHTNQIKELKRFLIEQNIKLIYDKATLDRIILSSPPSGNRDDENAESK